MHADIYQSHSNKTQILLVILAIRFMAQNDFVDAVIVGYRFAVYHLRFYAATSQNRLLTNLC